MTELKNKLESKLGSLENSKSLQIRALKCLQASRMRNDEKKMWFAMLPYMDENHLKRFVELLEKENMEVIDLYLSFLK